MSERKERTPRLGRGLAALYGDLAQEGNDRLQAMRTALVTSLVRGPFQPRQDMGEEALDELATSIRAHGILQPILVRPHPEMVEHFQIIAGERRWRAAQLVGLHEVPIHILDLDDADAFAAALIENLQRQDLNPIEEAEGLRRLGTEFGLSQDVLATSVGKSRSHIANMFRLLTLPATVQSDVRRGALSAGHARALLMHADPERAAMTVLARGLSVRQTEALARVPHRPIRPQAPTAADLDTASLERKLSVHLGLTAKISFDGRRGQVVLSYQSLDQLEGLLQLLGVGESK